MTPKASKSIKCPIIHAEDVVAVKEKMPPEEGLYDLAEFFKVFGDPTRIKIICALQSAELCVCDIAHVLEMSHSAISHQLRLLKQSRLVKYRKEGKIVYYSLDDDHVRSIFQEGFHHLQENRRG